MIRGAIFDMDGTIVDSMPVLDSMVDIYLKKRGFIPDPDLIDKLWEMSFAEGSVYVRERYGIADDPETIQRDIIADVEEVYTTSVPAKEGVEALLRELAARGIPMAIASSGYPHLIEGALGRLGLREYFSEIFSCPVLKTNKRVPLIYLTAAEHLGFAPGEIAVFEDVVHSLRTAKGAGFVTVGVEDPASEKDRAEILELSDYYLDSYTDSELARFWDWFDAV